MFKRLALIDGKNIFYRGFYAMPWLKTADGQPAGGVYGFSSFALELLDKLQPDYVVVAWDKPKTNVRWRQAIYPPYKTRRKPAPPEFYAQVPLLREFLSALQWPLYELDDYEATDIMATLARQAETVGAQSLLLSVELDMLQLVDPHTKLFTIKRGFMDIEQYDIAAFEQKYGISIHQLIDFRALVGDSGRTIPGVPGIGAKTAATLLQKYGSLEEIFTHLEAIKPAWQTKLKAGHELARISRTLATFRTDAPIKLNVKADMTKALSVERLQGELERLGFYVLLERLQNQANASLPKRA
ncbi:MAG: hypothetical protein LBU07_01910 [Coriobacteriales bacterium]|jgi:DNA polymerase-1|nr:hypothetical protein [Coriobacteriales bacterium]